MADIEITAISAATGSASVRSLSSIRTRVQKNLGNDTDYFPDSDVDEYINQALDECAEISGAYQQVDSQTTASGTYLYTLPSNCIQVKEVLYNGAPLSKRDLNYILQFFGEGDDPADSTGVPNYYADYSLTQLWLYPTPSAAQTLQIIYSGYPSALSADGDYSPFLKIVDRIAENWATSRMYLRDQEPGQASYYERLYKKDRARFHVMCKNKPLFTENVEDYGDALDE